MDQARLGWWEGDHFRIATARLQNISNGGAALTLACDAPVAPVWMSVVRPGASDWVLARIAGVSAADGGGQYVRLSFVEPCPNDIFEAAVRGTSPLPEPKPAAAAPSLPPRTRRRRRDLPCRYGAWGGPSVPEFAGAGMKKWSGLFEYLKYF